jgi:hypothetical protein
MGTILEFELITSFQVLLRQQYEICYMFINFHTALPVTSTLKYSRPTFMN